jgi:hypothetical protein
MPSPVTVSLQVPYSENEQQFLVLAVQTAVRTFRSLHAHSGDRTLQLSPAQSDPSTSATHAQPAVQESEV